MREEGEEENRGVEEEGREEGESERRGEKGQRQWSKGREAVTSVGARVYGARISIGDLG